MHPNVVGALVNSALYLVCVFTAGIATDHPWAMKIAIMAMGAAYISHYAQIAGVARSNTIALVALSVLLGASAGLALLF